MDDEQIFEHRGHGSMDDEQIFVDQAIVYKMVRRAKGAAKAVRPPCVRATGYCRAMAQCALQNSSAQHSARHGSRSWVCNPMS